MTGEPINLLVVLGPTASGKTRLGLALARTLGGQIVSADSRQVYRGLDIGTGKDLAEYGHGSEAVDHHLIDIVDPSEQYSLFAFQQDCHAVLRALWAADVLPVLVGGTGLYLEAVLLGYELVEAPEDPELRACLAELSFEQLVSRLRVLQPLLHNTTDLADRERLVRAIEIASWSTRRPPPPRPALRPLVLGTRFERQELHERIDRRLAERLAGGLIEEVAGLQADGLSWERLDRLGLEYRWVADYLRGRIPDRAALHAGLSRAIRQFARRQLAWFGRMQRRGIEIHWVARADPEAALELVGRFIRPGTDGPAVPRGPAAG